MTPAQGTQGGSQPDEPKYELEEVRRLARLAIVHRQRATRLIVARLGLSEPAAETYARRKVAALRPENFVKSDLQDYTPPIWADIYALSDEDGNWFIKFYMENGRVTIVSCHGPEHDLVCIDGSVIKEQQP